MGPLDEYCAVVARVDGFSAEVSGRRAADLACRAGCSGCCQSGLEVAPVEAAAIRAHLAAMPEQARRAIAAQAAAESDRCNFLDEAGRCLVYAARPLVCRTQGLPLRYPPGFVPAEAVGLRLGERGDATWCPLNFREREPDGRDILDAELVDRLLAVVNQRFCAREGIDPLTRIPLAELVG